MFLDILGQAYKGLQRDSRPYFNRREQKEEDREVIASFGDPKLKELARYVSDFVRQEYRVRQAGLEDFFLIGQNATINLIAYPRIDPLKERRVCRPDYEIVIDADPDLEAALRAAVHGFYERLNRERIFASLTRSHERAEAEGKRHDRLRGFTSRIEDMMLEKH